MAIVSQLCISFPYVLHGLCEDYLTCDIAFNAVMPLSRASTRGRYSRIEGVTSSHCLVLSRSKHDSNGHTLSLSLLTAGHKSSRILSAGEGEKVQCSRGRPRRRLLPTAGVSQSACLAVLSQAPLAREGLRPLLPCYRSVGRSGLPPPT